MSTIIETLKEHAPELTKKYGVRRLAVFGSVARGEERPDSDVDMLVEFEGRATFDGYMGLKFDLEGLLSRNVDLATMRMLKPRMKNEILADAVDVA